jgi:hypothetical protein
VALSSLVLKRLRLYLVLATWSKHRRCIGHSGPTPTPSLRGSGAGLCAESLYPLLPGPFLSDLHSDAVPSDLCTPSSDVPTLHPLLPIAAPVFPRCCPARPFPDLASLSAAIRDQAMPYGHTMPSLLWGRLWQNIIVTPATARRTAPAKTTRSQWQVIRAPPYFFILALRCSSCLAARYLHDQPWQS